MSAGRNQYFLLLLLLVLTHGCSANPVTAPKRNYTSAQPSSTRARIIYVTGVHLDDYDYEDDQPTEVSKDHPTKVKEVFPPQLCDYDFCRDHQPPCTELSESSSCLCPGLSGPGVPPQPPRLKSMTKVGSGVEVRWCAPASTVVLYRVMVQGSSPVTFGELSRQGIIGNLESGDTVCVQAVNNAGSSNPSEFSCSRYELQEGNSLALRTGLIAGGLGLLLVLSVVAFVLWRCKTCHKAACNSEGLGNPSYTADGTM